MQKKIAGFWPKNWENLYETGKIDFKDGGKKTQAVSLKVKVISHSWRIHENKY